MSLQPLSEAESEALVAGLAGGLPARHVVEAAEGNPLFLEQLLAFESENGHEDERPAAPPTIHALLGARIDRLEASERVVLERASVEGRLFHLGAVSELLPEQTRPLAGASVLSLVRKELVRPDESLFPGDDGFRFAHILLRDVAYEGMPKVVRGEAHERFAAWLEGKAAARVAEYEEILAYHLEQAASYGRELRPRDERTDALAQAAAERLTTTGRRALARGDLRAGANLLERALVLLPPDDFDRLSLVPDLFEGYVYSARFGDAEVLLAEAEQHPAIDKRSAAVLSVLRAWLGWTVDPDSWSERAVRAAEAAIPVFEAAGDHASLSRAWLLVHIGHWNRGELEAARRAAERGLEAAERAGEISGQAQHRESILGAFVFGPASLEECLPLLERELDWTRATGARGMEGSVLVALGEAHAGQGRVADGSRLVAEGDALLRDLGSQVFAAAHTSSWVHVVSATPSDAERELRRAYETLSEAGEKGFLSTVAAYLAEVVLEQGGVKEATGLLDEASEACGGDDVTTQVIVLRVRAKLLTHEGEDEEAIRLAREAVARASATEYALLRADALRDLAVVLARIGRSVETADVLGEAIAAYQRKGYTVLADRARARLAELQAAGSPSQ